MDRCFHFWKTPKKFGMAQKKSTLHIGRMLVLFSVKGNPLYALQWTESTKPVQEPNLLE